MRERRNLLSTYRGALSQVVRRITRSRVRPARASTRARLSGALLYTATRSSAKSDSPGEREILTSRSYRQERKLRGLFFRFTW